MPPTTIPAPVLKELNRQFNDELAAAHAYLALSTWCAVRNLKGFAGHFAKQAGEEREHADKMMRHLVDRGATPELGAIPEPTQKFDSLVAVAEQARRMEQANTRGIHAAFEAAVAAKDYAAQVFLHWFVNEQVEEEAWTAEMLDRVEGATCAGSMLDLDRHIGKLLADGSGS
jgi:ferritin